MIRFLTAVCLLALVACNSPGIASETPVSSPAASSAGDSEALEKLKAMGYIEMDDDVVIEETEGHGWVHKTLLYIPNRIFDVFDVVRARVRIGPGMGVSVRATDYVDVNLGGYAAMYVGLPGPRGEPRISLPIGAETWAGAEISVLEASTGDALGPDYGTYEFGAGFHAAFIGFDFGLDPTEIVDLLLGIALFDPNGDDL